MMVMGRTVTVVVGMDGYDEDNFGNVIIEMVMVVAMRKKRQWGSGMVT